MTKVSASQNKARGKVDERDIARRIGGHRHPADTGGDEDIEHPSLSVQVKGGLAVVTQVMRNAMASAKASANYPAKLPAVVCVDRKGTRLARYIVFDLDQWCYWNGYPGNTMEADEAPNKRGSTDVRTSTTRVDS